jgi:hypothetical protein
MHEPGYLEPWLRGTRGAADPITDHLLRSSEQIREDSAIALKPLSVAQIWAKPAGMTSAGFHAKHLAGSTQRLCIYLEGAALTDDEVAAISLENYGTETADQLIQAIGNAFAKYETIVRHLKPDDFASIRRVGRKQLPVTAVSLAIHIAEHAHRHVGQLISAAKLSRAQNA